MNTFIRGQAVVDITTNKMWDYGYEGMTGYCICYYHGECNGQDAVAIKPELLRPATLVEIENQNWADYGD